MHRRYLGVTRDNKKTPHILYWSQFNTMFYKAGAEYNSCLLLSHYLEVRISQVDFLIM